MARPSWLVVGPIVALVVAAGVTVAVVAQDDGDEAPTAQAEDGPLAVSSDAPRWTTLDAMVEASDLVVAATVTTTEAGRAFGDPEGTTIESRIVTLRIDEVLSGAAPAGPTIRLEEEATLADGTPIVVDGLVPAPEGTEGIWFLDAVEGGEAPTYVLVGPQGRYLMDGSEVVSAEEDDALAEDADELGLAGLLEAILAAGTDPVP